MAAVSDHVTTTVSELADSRVRLHVEISSKELERGMGAAAKRLGQNLRVPGFRRGKVPPPVVVRQLGREAVLDDAIRTELGRWYAEALSTAKVDVVGDPDLELGELPEAGGALTFDVEVGVVPTATLGEYEGVEVGRREPEVGEDTVDAEVEKLRESAASLEPKDGAAETGDYVVMDYLGSIDGTPFAGGEGRDQTVELGSGQLIPGFEDQLAGGTAGEERTVEVTFPAEYGNAELAGKDASFAVTVKEVQAKRIPELTDEFAEEVAGFDSLAELREDISTRLREAEEQRIEEEFREAVLDAVAANATIDVPDALVEARAKDLWERMIHSLSHQGISREMYLQISQRTEADIVEEAKPEAAAGLRREATLAALVEAADIEPSDGDVLDALQASAARESVKVEKLRDKLAKDGRLDDLVGELAQRQAVDLIVEKAKPITVEQAKAKSLLWTPDSDEKEADGAAAGGRPQLWTPGS